MATVKSLTYAGKTLNVPHSEHRVSGDVEEKEKNAVTFGDDGLAEVSDVMAASLLEFYPRYVERVESVESVEDEPVPVDF